MLAGFEGWESRASEPSQRADHPAQPVEPDLFQFRRDDTVLHGGGDLLGRVPHKPVLPVRPRRLPAWLVRLTLAPSPLSHSPARFGTWATVAPVPVSRSLHCSS
jgi:hypothetical protein